MLVELSVMEQRYQAVLAVIQDGWKVVEVADRLGVSRQAVHTWIARYQAGGLSALADRSHRPASCPHQIAPQTEALVCELRREHPGWGLRRIAHQLARSGAEPVPSLSAVYRCLRRHRLIELRRRRKRRDEFRRWERDRPMQLWQMDVMGGVELEGGTELKVVTGVDDHSRFCVAAGLVRRATSKAVCEVLAGALARYGTPDEILTDNGKCFTGRFGPNPTEVLFDRILRENGISHRHTGVRSPTTTGKVERFHQSLRREFLAGKTFPSVEAAQSELDAWVTDYSTNRPHQSLEMATPAERFPALLAVQDRRLDSRGSGRRPPRPMGPSTRGLERRRLGRQPDVLGRQRLPSRARRRVRGRDHDPGLEQEPPHQDGRQSPVRARQKDQSRWTARQASTGYEASSLSRNLTPGAQGCPPSPSVPSRARQRIQTASPWPGPGARSRGARPSTIESGRRFGTVTVMMCASERSMSCAASSTAANAATVVSCLGSRNRSGPGRGRRHHDRRQRESPRHTSQECSGVEGKPAFRT